MYKYHYQRCLTHGLEFGPDAGRRTQRNRAQSGATSPIPSRPSSVDTPGGPAADIHTDGS